jgi:hypothetical protein
MSRFCESDIVKIYLGISRLVQVQELCVNQSKNFNTKKK